MRPARGSSKKRRRFHRRTAPGASPGTLVADPEAPRPVLSVLAYGPGEVREEKIDAPEVLRELAAGFPVVWLNVDGLGDADMIRRIGAVFGLHRLALEDVLHVHQRAKVEPYGDHLFIVARMVSWCGHLETEQLSLFLGKGFVITFQERAGDGFGAVRERIQGGGGLLRSSGTDYLAYALLDAVIDEYFPVLEAYGEKLETLEDDICLDPRPDSLQRVHAIKRDLLTLRRAVWPQREALNFLSREQDALIQPETRPYLADCYDHTVQIMDLVETYREIASGLMEIYLSSLSNRLNEVMKVLTVVGTISIPLVLLTGVYGMNFDHMPELHWRYGYIAVLVLMALSASGLLYYFKRKGWLDGSRVRSADAEQAPPTPRERST